VFCDIDFLTPAGLTFEQTDQYDPNPESQIKLREWHLTARTAEKRQKTEFVTVYWPHQAKDQIKKQAVLRSIDGGYALTVELTDRKLTALLPTNDNAILHEPDGLTTTGVIKLKLEHSGTQQPQILEVRQGYLH